MICFVKVSFEAVLTFPGEQGWRSVESARLPPMWLGYDSQTSRRHKWVEFVGSQSARGFSPGAPGTPDLPSPQNSAFNLI